MPVVATDLFAYTPLSWNMPSPHQFAMAPDDANDQPYVTRLVDVSGPCTISYVDSSGATVNNYALSQGKYSIRIRRLLATGTTLNGATLMGWV